MRLLLCTDLHLSDKPRDRYRFDFIPHLAKQVRAEKANGIVILGDITERKDNHSALLTNSIIASLRILAAECPVYIIKGNHDYQSNPNLPFFKFLNHIKGIMFITKPVYHHGLLFVPHLTDVNEWRNLYRLVPDAPLDSVFIHQTVSGAISESGQRLDGFPLKPLKRLKCKVFGGDIHKPQTLEPVIYIGPPYHIRFGDNFTPRYLLLDTAKQIYKEFHFTCPRKWMFIIRDVDELDNKDIREGDQVKVKLELTREEVTDWAVMKADVVKAISDRGAECFGVELKVWKQSEVKPRDQRRSNEGSRDPSEIVRNFSKREKLSSTIRDVGLELLKG